jgi:hypothetical protein
MRQKVEFKKPMEDGVVKLGVEFFREEMPFSET